MTAAWSASVVRRCNVKQAGFGSAFGTGSICQGQASRTLCLQRTYQIVPAAQGSARLYVNAASGQAHSYVAQPPTSEEGESPEVPTPGHPTAEVVTQQRKRAKAV
jgi:hypothetical protein